MTTIKASDETYNTLASVYPKHSKWINISTAVSWPGWMTTVSLKRSIAKFIVDSNGVWIMDLFLSATFDSTSAPEFDITGILAKNISSYHGTGSMVSNGTGTTQGQPLISPNGNSITIRHNEGVTYTAFHMIFELNAEPTWTAFGTTKAAAME